MGVIARATEPLISAAGLSGLTPTTSVRSKPKSLLPTSRPACVPPDDEETTIASKPPAGQADVRTSSSTAATRPKEPTASDAPSGTT